MGYTTTFTGRFDLDRPLTPEHKAYLACFAGTRRMKRVQIMLNDLPDSLRVSVGLPVGYEGEYFVAGEAAGDLIHDFDDPSVLDDSEPPADQPGLWCHWVPTADGIGIEWNGREKFYRHDAWLFYLIYHFLKPWGYTLNGQVQWLGQDRRDYGVIHVANNRILDFHAALERADYENANDWDL